MNHSDRLDATINSLSDAINNGMHHHTENAQAGLDEWIQALQGLGGSALTGIVGQLTQLKDHIRSGDKVALSEAMQHLGEQTSQTARDLHNATGDQLRHLGQLLIMASGNIKMS